MNLKHEEREFILRSDSGAEFTVRLTLFTIQNGHVMLVNGRVTLKFQLTYIGIVC